MISTLSFSGRKTYEKIKVYSSTERTKLPIGIGQLSKSNSLKRESKRLLVSGPTRRRLRIETPSIDWRLLRLRKNLKRWRISGEDICSPRRKRRCSLFTLGINWEKWIEQPIQQGPVFRILLIKTPQSKAFFLRKVILIHIGRSIFLIERIGSNTKGHHLFLERETLSPIESNHRYLIWT